MDVHVANLTNGWELYKYQSGGGFCYRVRKPKNIIDYRIHSSCFPEPSYEGRKAIDSFVIQYLEDIIKHKDGCAFASTYSFMVYYLIVINSVISAIQFIEPLSNER
jgi:hypothetical protein